MKIGILGAGNVGGTLGQAWAKKGHQVVFGVRDVSDPELQQRLVAVGENFPNSLCLPSIQDGCSVKTRVELEMLAFIGRAFGAYSAY